MNIQERRSAIPSPESLVGARMVQYLRQIAGEPVRFDQALLLWNSMDGDGQSVTESTFRTFNTINHNYCRNPKYQNQTKGQNHAN